MKKIILFITLFFGCSFGFAQRVFEEYKLDASTNGQTIRTSAAYFYDSGGEDGNYSPEEDYEVTFRPDQTSVTKFRKFYYKVTFLSFDIDAPDTLFIYDQGSPVEDMGSYSPMRNVYNSMNKIQVGTYHNAGYVTGGNPTDYENTALTFKFKSAVSSAKRGAGWKAKIECIPYCQKIEVALDNTFDKLINGQRVTFPVKNEWEYRIEAGQQVRYDYQAIDICNTDTVILKARSNYPENNERYEQSDATSIFLWSLSGLGRDTILEGKNELLIPFITKSIGYLGVGVQDIFGCKAISSSEGIRIHIGKNPIKQINKLPTVYTDQKFNLSAGVMDKNTIQIDTSTSSKIELQTASYNSLTFIPDYGNCTTAGTDGDNCLRTNVNVVGYPSGFKIRSAKDILALCLNIEHSRAQDLSISLICPSGKKVDLLARKTGLPMSNETAFGTRYFAPPITGNWPSTACDPNENNPSNLPDIYCWSEYYSTAQENRGNIWNYVGASGKVPPTDYEAKRGFYMPNTSFDNLIGCPYNGTWSLKICDYQPYRNGYIHNWQLEFAEGIKTFVQTKIDTVIWKGDFTFLNTAKTSAEVLFEKKGTQMLEYSVVDSFGCHWDTTADITILNNGNIIFKDFPEELSFEKMMKFSVVANLGDREKQDLKLRLQIPEEHVEHFRLTYTLGNSGNSKNLSFTKGVAYVEIPFSAASLESDTLDFQMTWNSELDNSKVLANKGDNDIIVPLQFALVSANNIDSLLSKVYEKEIVLNLGKNAIIANDLSNKNELKIYPNPIGEGEVLSIELPFGNEELAGVKIEILDINGRIVRTLSPKSVDVRMKMDFGKGSYILRVRKNESTVSNMKILVK